MISIKINIRHSNTGGTVRTLSNFTNFSLSRKFNSFASTFSFDFYFDPTNQEHAELVCVSHLHECLIYWNNTLILTGYLLTNKFIGSGKPELVTVSGYSKSGVYNDCDVPKECYPLEINGLSLKSIIEKIIRPFNIGIQIDSNATNINKSFVVEERDEDDDDEEIVTLNPIAQKSISQRADDPIDKTAPESTQNIASYLTDLASQMNIIISHTPGGQLWITNPATKGTPILNFDFTSSDPNNDARKIPGLRCELEFNGQGLHTHIRVVQQADEEEETNASDITIRNPLIPIKKRTLFRPKTVIADSGTQFTLNEIAKYTLGKEIRDNVTLKIDMAMIDIDGVLIQPNNTITIKYPAIFLYKTCTWFIQSIDYNITPSEQTCTLNCVLPFGYDFDLKALKNVFVDVHANFPRQ